jgi:putative endonuclease
MAKHNSTGNFGEVLAQHYFEQAGYEILAVNWRFSHWEIDIIAHKNAVLHFIEVKTRRTKHFGQPEESVTNKKMKHLISAAEQYLYEHPQWKRIQFDLLAITLLKDGANPAFFLIEDIYT